MSSTIVSCPACSHELTVTGQEAGASEICPMCQTSFVIPSPEKSASLPLTEDSAGQGQSVDAPGLDPAEQHDPQMSSKAAANACLACWRSDMPAVPSAYQPSGKVPAPAVVAMALGAGLGVLGATLAALASGAVTVGLLTAIAWAIKGMGKVQGKVLVLVWGLGCAALLAGYAAMYLLTGWIAAWCTTRVGQWLGKNRSGPAAAVFSIVATGVSLTVLHLCLQSLGPWCDPGEFLRGQFGGGQVEWLVRGLEIAGAILAVYFAGNRASAMVGAKKFCEECELFMEESRLPQVGLGGLRILTAALNTGEMEAASYLLEEPPAGEEGKAILFHCPICGAGFLEIHAHFHANFTKEDGKKESTKESWMTVSVPLQEKESELFRPFIFKT